MQADILQIWANFNRLSQLCRNGGSMHYGDNEIQTLHKPVWNDIFHVMINLFSGFCDTRLLNPHPQGQGFMTLTIDRE